MRVGINPEKEKSKKLKYKLFRIIIPLYIPENEAAYFNNALQVFQKCMYSLFETIDEEKTNITIINNNCKKDVTDYVNDLLSEKRIDRHVHCKENYGKIYTVIQEARGCYEKYIAIVDSDVFFFTGWQVEVLKVFENFKNVGVVGLTPDVNTAFYCNSSLFFKEWLFVKKGKIVDNKELELFEEGINKKDFFITINKNWKNSQFYLEKNNVKAIVGAGHFASVYKKEVFKHLTFKKPIYVFPGGELNFLDKPLDKQGYYRLSLIKAFAYHMGNTIPEWLLEKKLKKNILNLRHHNEGKKSDLNFYYFFKSLFLRILRRFKFYK
ncbi:glycosyltransferase family 2 protein [uncultured Flavobacterium sp.]|uniref:glycosyltransferase family A protein n=1 Tax=uncultured Flavobacterium sp. TaxID=165435 RepID=UPI0030C7AC8E